MYTIGHSTRAAEDFLQLLQVHGIRQVADVRAAPRSRRHPQFGKDALEPWLAAQGMVYRHFGELGGLRTPRADSRNGAWRNPAFRGYADYMQTPAFHAAVDMLLAFAAGPTAVMCAEGRWEDCHRRLLSDALVARGAEVRHIVSVDPPKAHALSEFARIDGATVHYPGLL